MTAPRPEEPGRGAGCRRSVYGVNVPICVPTAKDPWAPSASMLVVNLGGVAGQVAPPVLSTSMVPREPSSKARKRSRITQGVGAVGEAGAAHRPPVVDTGR